MSAWIAEHWIPKQERDDYITVITAEICINSAMLAKFTEDIKLAKTFVFKGYSPVDNPDFIAYIRP